MKTRIILVSLALASLFSCSKPDTFERPEEKTNFKQLAFNVEVETTKTTIDDLGQVSWSKPDSVLVLWGGGSAIGTIANDSLKVEAPVADAYYAVYPADATASLDAGALTVTIPSTVDGSFSKANYMAAKAVGGTFAFKHICGIMKIDMPAGYKKIEFRANDSKTSTAGTETVTFDAEGGVTVATATAEEAMSSASAAEFAEGPIYIPVRADAVWDLGVAFKITETDSGVSGTLSTKAVTWNRTKLLDAGNVVGRIHNWYIKETACGKKDGSSWDNAGDASLIVKLLSKNIWVNGDVKGEFTDGVPNGLRLHNRKIYIAAGSYDLLDNGGTLTMNYSTDLNLEIKGGFSATAEGTDLTSYDPVTNVTNLYAGHSAAGTSKRLFNGQAAYRTFKFTGLHFDNLPESCSGARGAVIYFNNNARTNTGSNYHGVIFTDCYFQNNTTAGLGLVDANFKTSANCGKIEFNNCVFKNNTCTREDGAGAAFGSESTSTTAIFNNCQFEGNYASNTTGYGGAICMMNGKATFNSCTFYRNRAVGGGSAASILGGEAYFNNCSFSENSTERVDQLTYIYSHFYTGTINVQNSSAASTVGISGCIFTNNTSTTWAADLYAYSRSANALNVYVDRSVFRAGSVGGSDCLLEKGKDNVCYPGRSIMVNVKNNSDAVVPVLAINNCTVSEPTATNCTSSCAISWYSTKLYLFNTTIYGGKTAGIRNDKSYSSKNPEYYAMNNIIMNKEGTNSINLNATLTKNWTASTVTNSNCDAGYNIMGKCKNRYSINAAYDATNKKWVSSADGKPYPATDGYVVKDDLGLTYNSEGGYYTFAIATGKENDSERPVQYTTASNLESFVQSKLPAFDTWLKTINTTPYSIDIRGEARNVNKLQPGSWDPGL